MGFPFEHLHLRPPAGAQAADLRASWAQRAAARVGRSARGRALVDQVAERVLPDAGVGEPARIFDWLSRWARRLLRHEGAHMCLEPVRNHPSEEVLRWRWMSLALPHSIWTAAACSPSQIPPARVALLDPSIRPVGPVALLHVHNGAVKPFEGLWLALCAMLLRESSRELTLRLGSRSGAPTDDELPLSDPARWAEALRQAALVREVLLTHFAHARSLDGPAGVACSGCELPPEWWELLRGFVARPGGGEAGSPSDGGDGVERSSLRPWPGTPLVMQEADLEERCLVRDGLHRAREGLLGEAFLQYLRVKASLWRHLVSDPADNGLRAFKERFDRIRKYDSNGAGRLSGLADEHGLDVRAVEVRCMPDTWRKRYLVGERGITSSLGTAEQGWVVHFSRGGGPKRWREAEAAARELEQVVRQRPDCLKELRGIDLAGLEREGPVWAFAKILMRLRDVSREAAASARDPAVLPLRLTLHVGEDFDHLATGLRAVHEPFVWELMERGDRLGHAFALGIAPSDWRSRLARRHRVQMRCWDRLLDLGWMYFALRVFKCKVDPQTIARLHRDAYPVGTTLFGSPFDRETAASQAARVWWELGAPDGRQPPQWLRSDALLAGLTRAELLEAGGRNATAPRSMDVEIGDDLQIMETVRGPLIDLITRWGVTIESNPSSNLLVSGSCDLFSQVAFQTRPTQRVGVGSLSVALSSDDPMTFATCLSDEFAYAWAGMLAHGSQPEYVRARLDEMAASSMRARFTVNRSGA